MKANKSILYIISLFVSYAISRICFKVIKFKYSIFNESFKLEKFIIDFGCWIIVFCIVQFIVLKIFSNKSVK